MAPRSEPRWARWLDLALVMGFATWVLPLMWTWVQRMPYPHDLEWMEGGMMAHGWRLQRGLPLYPEPSADWVPYVYPPGYSALLALAGEGLDFWWGRLLSAVGTLAASAALVAGVKRHGGSVLVGLLSACAFLLSYRSSGAFFDLVRPDAIGIALAAWAIVLSTDGRRGTDVSGGLLLAAAFVVKHNLAIFGVPLALGLWAWRGWRTALRFGLAAMLPALLLTGYLQWRSDGGFLTYLLEVPRSHPMMWPRGFPGAQGETGHWLFPVMVATGLGFALTARGRDSEVHPLAFAAAALGVGAVAAYVGVSAPPVNGAITPDAPVMGLTFFSLGAGVGAALVSGVAAIVERRVDGRWWTAFGLFWTAALAAVLMRAHNGGFINVLIPWHWVICGLAGVFLARLRRVSDERWAAAAVGASTVAFAGQLALSYALLDLDRTIPDDEDRAAHAELVADLAERCDGPIFSPFAAWLPVQAGEEPSAHLIAIWDIAHKQGPLFDGMASFPEAMKEHHFACVVDAGRQPLPYGVPENYRVARRIKGRAMATRTGWPVHPHTIRVPKGTRRQEPVR